MSEVEEVEDNRPSFNDTYIRTGFTISKRLNKRAQEKLTNGINIGLSTLSFIAVLYALTFLIIHMIFKVYLYSGDSKTESFKIFFVLVNIFSKGSFLSKLLIVGVCVLAFVSLIIYSLSTVEIIKDQAYNDVNSGIGYTNGAFAGLFFVLTMYTIFYEDPQNDVYAAVLWEKRWQFFLLIFVYFLAMFIGSQIYNAIITKLKDDETSIDNNIIRFMNAAPA
jgi:hypothetical protein